MNPNDLKFLNAFNIIPGMGPATLRTLKTFFGSFENAWNASEPKLQEAGVSERSLLSIRWKRNSIHPDREMSKLFKENIWLIAEDEALFPKYLKEIPQPPLALYGKGDAKLFNEFDSRALVAVVGTRKPTHYGLDATETIVSGLADAGVFIVSGLALGIDARSHQTAIDCKGKTIAILGSGIDFFTIYPQENRGLASRIVDSGGLLLSEYAPGTPALREHFPQRNRIVSGLSRGVFVVEAKEKSGALITARLALEQNREVFALPGSIYSHSSRGPNLLIQSGAKLVLDAEDILEELGIDYTKKKEKNITGLLSEKERILLEHLSEPLTVGQIKQKTGMPVAEIIATLSLLELKGFARNAGAGAYQKTYA